MTSPLDIVLAIEGSQQPGWSIAFVHDSPPVPKARARVVRVRGKTVSYTPPATKSAEEQLAWSWRVAARGRTFEGPLALGVIFYRPDRRVVDLDNLVKLTCDSGNRARVWRDDSQIVVLAARIDLDAARPRTEVALIPSSSTLVRQSTRSSR